jgi:hypothetical protein
MFNHLAVCFDFTAVNDPSKTDSAFVGDPFMLFLYPMPWLALGILLFNGDFAEIMAISNYQLPITLLTICLSVIVIWQHYNLRRLGAEISDCPTK